MILPVITVETACELNAQAQALDPILFWTCNYEPTISYAISEDARFLTGIQDLYKFAIDTNCVLRGIAYNYSDCICPNLLPVEVSRELRNLIDTIQTLRAVLDHNQSEMSGSLFSNRAESFANWVRSIIGKDQPANSGDFAMLNQELKIMGEALVSLSRKTIDFLRQRSDSKIIVQKWTDAILKWYCDITRRDYYKSQLADYYTFRACARRASFYSSIQPKKLYSKVNRWINEQVTQSFNEPLNRAQQERVEIQEHLNNPSDRELKIKSKMPDMYNQVLEERKRRLIEIDTEEENLRKERDAFEKRYGRNRNNYFFEINRFYGQLRDTLDILREEGEGFTLLPQDFLQKDVERVFAEIRCPDKDF